MQQMTEPGALPPPTRDACLVEFALCEVHFGVLCHELAQHLLLLLLLTVERRRGGELAENAASRNIRHECEARAYRVSESLTDDVQEMGGVHQDFPHGREQE